MLTGVGSESSSPLFLRHRKDHNDAEPQRRRELHLGFISRMFGRVGHLRRGPSELVHDAVDAHYKAIDVKVDESL